MKVIEMSQATSPLSEYMQDVDKEPLIFTVGGKPVAALVSIENADWETVSLSTNPEFIELIEQSRAHYKSEGGISSEEMRRRLGLERTG